MKKKSKIKSRNISIMYFETVIAGLLFFLPILALYFEESLFTVTNVALIFAVGAVTFAILEIPTGAIADLFGRKNTYIFAHFVNFIAIIFLYIGGKMFFFILYAVLNALAKSLASGTDNALIYDTLKDENKEHYYKKVIGTFYALWPLGASVGAIIGGHLAKISLSFPVLITLIPVGISFILTLFLKEPNYEKEGHKNILKHMYESSKLVCKNSQLIIILIGGLIIWAFGETTHYLNPLFFQFKEISIVYFGYIAAFGFGLSSLGHYLSHAVSEKLGNKTTIIMSVIASPLLLILATLTTKFTAIAFFVIPSLFFGFRNPVINHLLNLEVSSSKRATILSISSFMNQLGVAVVIPFIGYLAELYTINTAFKISAVFMFSVPLIFLLLKDKK